MRGRFLQWAPLAVAAFVGLAGSALLLAMYMLPAAATSCGAHGGCATVRACRYSTIAGVQMPTVGVVAFLLLLIVALSERPEVRRWLPLFGAGAAVGGAGLIALQHFGCHAICKFCLVPDIAGLAAGLAVLLQQRVGGVWIEGESGPGRGGRVLFALVAVAAVVVPFGYERARAMDVPVLAQQLAHLPDPIAREQRAGAATIVEFADFQCPYCRRQHLQMAEVVASYGPRVHFVRKHVPLSFHEHANDAARAACCAEEQGRGDAVADALFRTEDLSVQGCEEAAVRAGVDRALYRSCLASDRPAQRITTDHADADHSGVEGLPTTFVGSERFDGVVTADTLRASIERALRRSETTRPQG